MAKKLFQHIVMEPEVKGAYEKIRAETMKVVKGADLFAGLTKEYTPKEQNGDPLPREQKEVVTTVDKRLRWNQKSVALLLDYELTRDRGNLGATADLVVNGITLATGVPATTLLSLEKRLREVREIYDAIPTLDMSRRWDAVDKEDGLYRYGPIEQYRTAKKTVPVILYAATDKHPAQVKDVVEDVTIGTYRTVHFSGAMHPGVKAAYLERIDALIEGAKAARMKANEVGVGDSKIGDMLFKFVHEGK